MSWACAAAGILVNMAGGAMNRGGGVCGCVGVWVCVWACGCVCVCVWVGVWVGVCVGVGGEMLDHHVSRPATTFKLPTFTHTVPRLKRPLVAAAARAAGSTAATPRSAAALCHLALHAPAAAG